jgi:hypothetical protein
MVKAGKSTSNMCHLNLKKTFKTTDLIACVTAAIKEDCCLSMEMITAAHGVSEETIFNILHEDLGLEKKSARWVPKFLNDDKKWRGLSVLELHCTVHRQSKSMLDCTVTRDVTMVWYHTPEM